jgi:hypothetical protein
MKHPLDNGIWLHQPTRVRTNAQGDAISGIGKPFLSDGVLAGRCDYTRLPQGLNAINAKLAHVTRTLVIGGHIPMTKSIEDLSRHDPARRARTRRWCEIIDFYLRRTFKGAT